LGKERKRIAIRKRGGNKEKYKSKDKKVAARKYF
jgi:hypothetical protein